VALVAAAGAGGQQPQAPDNERHSLLFRSRGQRERIDFRSTTGEGSGSVTSLGGQDNLMSQCNNQRLYL
jgi:hypothetical protein